MEYKFTALCDCNLSKLIKVSKAQMINYDLSSCLGTRVPRFWYRPAY
jgi:hypothetical protein